MSSLPEQPFLPVLYVLAFYFCCLPATTSSVERLKPTASWTGLLCALTWLIPHLYHGNTLWSLPHFFS